MAHHHSALKSLRASKVKNARNREYKSEFKTAVKRVLQCKLKTEADAEFRKVTSIIDSLTTKNIINRRLGARKKSQLAQLVNRLS